MTLEYCPYCKKFHIVESHGCFPVGRVDGIVTFRYACPVINKQFSVSKVYRIEEYNEHNNTKYGKYIGKHVIAGSGFKSIRGKIVDVKDEYDELLGWSTTFYVKDENSPHTYEYAKEEICEIVPQIQETYIELE
jgi:hypothetical protein